MNSDGRRRTAFELLAFPDMTWRACAPSGRSSAASRPPSPRSSRSTRATTSIAPPGRRHRGLPQGRGHRIPAALDYAAIAGLSTELRQKLEKLRPATLAQAARIDGMTPAALMLLLAHLRKAPARKSA